MRIKVDPDLSVTPKGFARRAGEYAGGYRLDDDRISSVLADLTGFPPLLIQVGGNEMLLDDATGVATRAAAEGVTVTLDVTPDAPHVFVSFAPCSTKPTARWALRAGSSGNT